MSYTLTIADETDTEILRVRTKRIDAEEAITAILAALKPLKELPPPRKRRSDAGKPKTAEPTL